MFFFFLLIGTLSQSTYYITVDDALSDILKKQPKGYKPWHPSLNVRLRKQEEERTQEFYSFVQQQIKIKQRGINTQHPMQFLQVQGPEFFENLVCKCSFSPAEAVQEEEEGGEGGGEEVEGGACEAEGSGEGEGEGEEVEFIMKKTQAHGKDFSFLQVGTQSNLNQYIPQPQQFDQLSQYDQRLQAQEQLIKQFMDKQNQLTQQISMLQQNQGVFVPSLFPQVVDPNFINPQQQAQMVYLLQLQQQQQQIKQQMLNPLSFQSNPTIIKNDNIQTQQQFQIPLQQPIQSTLNPQQILLQQQQLSEQYVPQQLSQQQLLQQQQLNQQQIQQGQSQVPQFQQQQIPSILTQPQQQFQGVLQQQQIQQQIPQKVQLQNQQQQSYQQIPLQQIQQQQQQQIPQIKQQNGFLQQQNIPQLDQLLIQQMSQPLMQPQLLQQQPQIL